MGSAPILVFTRSFPTEPHRLPAPAAISHVRSLGSRCVSNVDLGSDPKAKPALRAAATREAVAEALRGVPSVTGVRATVEEGAVVAVVGLASDADETSVGDVLDRFAITWRLELS